MRTILKSVLLVLMALVVSQSIVWSQGSTSSRINGQVVSNGESLIGAAVLATHTPTGFEYGTTTNVEGYFTLNNVSMIFCTDTGMLSYRFLNLDSINIESVNILRRIVA